MYKYEEFDFNQIINNSNIDMDSPEALYAIACCYRDGKGVEKSEERYQEYLQEAIKNGMEVPAESDRLKNSDRTETKQCWEQASFATSGEIAECERQAENGNAEACLALYKFCMEIEDFDMANYYIQKVEANASSADTDLQQHIYITVAEWYKSDYASELALASYKRAVESGSIVACWNVCEYYEDEEDSEERREKLEYYRGKIEEYGSNEDIFRLAMTYKSENALIKAFSLLERLYGTISENAVLKAECLLEMMQLNPARYPAEQAVFVLWDASDKETVFKKLVEIYGNDPNQISEALLEALTPKQAVQLASWYLKHQDITVAQAWVDCAKEDPDGSVLNLKEKIKAIKEEEERQQRERERKLLEQQKKAAEEAERLRREREQQEKLRLQKQKEAEEAERLRKERELREKQKLLQQKKAEQERLLKERVQKEQEERQKEQERQAQIAMKKFFQGIILCILTVIWIIGVSKGFFSLSDTPFFIVIIIVLIAIFQFLQK